MEMDAQERLRRWPYDSTEALACGLLRCYVAVDGMLRDGLGGPGWSPTEIADELLRRLHTRTRHIAEDFDANDVTITLNMLGEMVNRLLPRSFDPEASPAFRPRDHREA